ncbi:MAG: hypothetical protein AAGK78_15695, partial [Planctomycetota bacterium]
MIAFAIPAYIVYHLAFTGSGIGAFGRTMFLMSSVGLFVLSWVLGGPAADVVYFVAWLFTVKWIAEYVWAV